MPENETTEARPTLEGSQAAMFRPVLVPRHVAVWLSIAVLAGSASRRHVAQERRPPGRESTPGQFFPIAEPITSRDASPRVRARDATVRRSSSGVPSRRTGRSWSSSSPRRDGAGNAAISGSATTWPSLISQDLGGAKLTVAYVPQPLKGFAVLPVVACTEIVMGASASLGPITPEGQPVDAAYASPSGSWPMRKTRDPDLLLGMLDRDADLRLVRTADKAVHYVLAENLQEFLKTHQVIEEQPAWEAGSRGVLTAKRAREEGFCKRTAESPAELANIYHLAGRSAVDDPTLGQSVRPVWIKLEGPLDNVIGLVPVAKDRGGPPAEEEPVHPPDQQPGRNRGRRRPDRRPALRDQGHEDRRLRRRPGARAWPRWCPWPAATSSSRRARGWATSARRSAGGTASLHDLSESRTRRPGQEGRALGDSERAPRGRRRRDGRSRCRDRRGQRLQDRRQPADPPLRGRSRPRPLPDPPDPQSRRDRCSPSSADEAASYGLGQVVADAEELKDLYGLSPRRSESKAPGWVDSLVAVLTDPYVSWMLLFIGVFMLVVELKLPGIGLPAIISALAFLLFFWSHYLSGTADQLEIILFLIGLVCLALELFVFPGFGVFGMSGILLMLCSIVLASHTFVWPTQDYEYHELGHTLLQLTGHADRRRKLRGGARPVLPLAAAVQPADPQARALDRRRVRRRARADGRPTATSRSPS